MQANSFRIVAVLILLTGSSGCASITRGTTEAYAIETVPPGATASLSNGLICETPCSLKVKRRSDFVVTIKREGYETVTASITSSVDGAGAAGMAGNVLIGGIIGAGIDAGTGAMHSHKPNPLMVTMVPENAPPGTRAITNIEPAVAEPEMPIEVADEAAAEGGASDTASTIEVAPDIPVDEAANQIDAGSN